MSSSSVPANSFIPGTETQHTSAERKETIRKTSSSLLAETKNLDELKPPETKRHRSSLSSSTRTGLKVEPSKGTTTSLVVMEEGSTQESCEGDTTSSLNSPQPSNFSSSSHRSGKSTVRFATPSVFPAGPSTAHEKSEQQHIGAPHKNGRSVVGDITQPVSAKKLVIRGFKQRPSFKEDDPFEEKWHPLGEAVVAIQKKKKAETSLEQLYEASTMKIYKKLKTCIYSYIVHELHILLDVSDSTTLFLQHLNILWLEYCEQLINVRSVFLYLDRTFVLHNPTVISLWDMGLEIFRDEVMDNERVRKRSVDGLLKMIEQEREGGQIDRLLIKSLLRMMTSLRVYAEVFERKFLETTCTLYEAEGRHLSQSLEVPAYLRHVKKRLEEETNRVDYYLDFTTKKPLLTVAERCLISDHMDSFINKGLDAMLLENKCEDLSLIYNMVSRTKHGLVILKNVFAAYVKCRLGVKFKEFSSFSSVGAVTNIILEAKKHCLYPLPEPCFIRESCCILTLQKVGKALVMDESRDKTLVADLLAMKRQLDAIVDSCFERNEKFIQAEKDAFDYFINTRPNKPAELVAKFMDSKLRSGNKGATEEEMENLMDEVIVLFRFIQGKDVFEAFYKKDLAKRLLLGRSASVDAEKSMLSKLKQECGAAFTTRLEGMFKDMEVSKDLGVSFKQYMEHGGPDRVLKHTTTQIEFSVNVLTMGHWPTYEYMEVAIPPTLAEYQEHFQNVVKELQVTMFQALVLLLFNDKLEWSLEEIQSATKIENNELERTMQSLACGKLRVLKKTPRGKDIRANDLFTFNPECNEKLYRIRISQVQMKETAVERAQTEEEIYQDRQYQIDAAIVRIMKTRKTLAHQLLISELFNQLRFPVKPVDLKKRIESLIEREYMCRDKDDSNIYNYLA
uniref:Cullin family profile domain-containing protein n=1 Tax=Setaria digitata TaxID=48799 RepID=A0A915PMJ1_9BILA